MQTLLKFFICGILSGFLFPPFFILPLGFIVFPLFFILINEKKLRDKNKFFHFLCGLFYGLGLYFISLIWIKDPFLIYKETSGFFILSYLLILYCSIYYGLSTLFLSYINNYFAKLLLIPVLFVFSEILLEIVGYGFPWITFSLVYSGNIFSINFIYYLGTYGLSYFTIIVFLLPTNIFLILYYKKNHYLKVYLLIILLIIIIFSSLVINRINTNKQIHDDQIDVTLAQLNLSLVNKNKNISKQNTINEIENIIMDHKSDLIIFSENNFPYIVRDLNQFDFIQDKIKENQTVIIGGTRKNNMKYYNTLFLIQKNRIQEYDKTKLVPFGEFLPLRKYLSLFKIIVGQNDYSKGTKSRHISISNDLNIIPIICYEIVFFKNLLNKNNFKNNLLINITNDSWFGKLSGPYQHLYISRARAVEYNKFLVRVSNNGVSAIINAKGIFNSLIPLNAKDILTTTITKPKYISNLTQYHDLIFIILIFVICIAMILNFKKNETSS